MPQVNYNPSNMQKCRCRVCPVHNTSACIMQKMSATGPQPGMLPDPDVVEGLYCSQAVNKSVCSDLNSELPCQCPTCAVWHENGLHRRYYCIHGSAA